MCSEAVMRLLARFRHAALVVQCPVCGAAFECLVVEPDEQIASSTVSTGVFSITKRVGGDSGTRGFGPLHKDVATSVAKLIAVGAAAARSVEDGCPQLSYHMSTRMLWRLPEFRCCKLVRLVPSFPFYSLVWTLGSAKDARQLAAGSSYASIAQALALDDSSAKRICATLQVHGWEELGGLGISMSDLRRAFVEHGIWVRHRFSSTETMTQKIQSRSAV
eukprot:1944738-Amphidinium_carterae.1